MQSVHATPVIKEAELQEAFSARVGKARTPVIKEAELEETVSARVGKDVPCRKCVHVLKLLPVMSTASDRVRLNLSLHARVTITK